MSEKERTFKLIFRTDGTFLHAEGPTDTEVQVLNFDEMNELKLYDKRGEEASFKDLLLAGKARVLTFDEMAKLELHDKRGEGVSVKDLLLTGRRESIRFIDIPGNSICGVIGAGIGYSWCR